MTHLDGITSSLGCHTSAKDHKKTMTMLVNTLLSISKARFTGDLTHDPT